MSAVCQIVKLPGCVYQRLCLKLRKTPRISQKTKLLELLTGSILSDILYLHILYDCNSSMFTSDQSYPLTLSREQRQLWFSAIKQKTIDFVWNSWLTADQNSTIQQFNSLGNTQIVIRWFCENKVL